MTTTQLPQGLSRRHLLAAPFALATVARAAQPALALPLPPVIDHSALLGPVKNQFDRDVCAYFAFTAAVEAALARLTGLPMALSEQFLTDLAYAGGPPPARETTSLNDPVALAKAHGMVPAGALPYRPRLPAHQLIRMPEPAVLAAALRINLKMAALALPTVEKLVRKLLTSPLIVPLAYPEDEAGWREDGWVVPVPALMESWEVRFSVPNHFVLLTGYDLRQQFFRFRSSWGPGWGQAGYGRISFDAMRTRWWTGNAAFVKSLTLA
ncbi:MAG: C1 family peptidase [Sphingomonadales bacterium]|jgi:hypothetical protein